VTNDTVKKR